MFFLFFPHAILPYAAKTFCYAYSPARILFLLAGRGTLARYGTEMVSFAAILR